ncbi:methyltransferase [Pseudidiomarina sp. 1APR75-15]|uniref:Methyltransferase n=1 Tax=Pseudidiomarina terrestris TaxID=2820060 RepID=A0ABT8MJ01_9GAMM|nr:MULTISPECIES: methyltransferase [unclassified Pseudidiomarina]MDN7129903.1 methyltransferase [Pseudidiomarina sp. 1APR75-15]MDN7138406.1 methyltransferase [Pseudidiomarina sp. 1ASP75-14]
MKVSTDSLILGSYVPVAGVCRALDLGTGSGLLALMLAQRQPMLRVDAIDADQDAVAQARENFIASPWPERMTSYLADVASWQASQNYDLIICNPPYFPQHLASATAAREMARQGLAPVTAWLACVLRNLSPSGQFYWVVPAAQKAPRTEAATACGLQLRDELLVYSTLRKGPRLVIQGWQREPCQHVQQRELVIHAGKGYSAEFRRLTGEFYLAGSG